MIKLYIITIPLAIISLLIPVGHLKAQSIALIQKPSGEVKIDGVISEWGGKLLMYDKDTKLNYGIASDDSCIYVMAISTDNIIKRKITMAGLTVSINAEGKKKKTFSASYPEAGKYVYRQDAENTPPQMIRLSGFKGLKYAIPALTNAYGFKAALNFDDDRNLGYEIAIPIKLLGLKPGAEIFINICVNGVQAQRETSGDRQSSSSGRTSSGIIATTGAAPVVGSTVANVSRSANYDDSGMSESQDFWVKLFLPALKQ